MSLELEIEPLPCCREGFARYADLRADKARRNRAIAVIFDQMRPQVSAILAIDDRAAGCAGVALVGSDQLQRIAEQFDMLAIDRRDAGELRPDQAHRIVTAADAGLRS